MEKICLSYDAKYLITVGNEPKPKIKFWIWTLGKEDCDGIVFLSFDFKNHYLQISQTVFLFALVYLF